MNEGRRLVALRAGAVRCRLRRPYQLSFGRLDHFLAHWFVARDAEGRLGVGEVVALPGYGHETADSVAATLARFAAENRGAAHAVAVARARSLIATSPFAASAILTALQLPAWLDEVPAPAAVNVAVTPDAEAQPDEARRLRAAGFRFLKVKIGRGFDADAALARRLLDAEALDVRLAFDANQGFALDEALRFAEVLADDPHRRVQWFEQPIDRADWAGLATLCAKAPVPIVLDESIDDAADAARAANIGAAGVKLKLCKHGGPDELAALLAALPVELQVIVGNGVATDVANAVELLVRARSGRCVAPAECCGFARLVEPLAFAGLTVDDGQARLTGDLRDALEGAVARWEARS
ncbi:MAG: hypothetical protein KC620_13865 [Myxococcales bacterium]|nr:hypothetical protein [Myxococcales bacterium]